MECEFPFLFGRGGGEVGGGGGGGNWLSSLAVATLLLSGGYAGRNWQGMTKHCAITAHADIGV
jgi:hypothetical protein